MSTPETQDADPKASATRKTISVRVENYARLARVADSFGGTMDQAVSLMFDRSVLRVAVGHDRRARWDEAAKASGMSTEEFVLAHIESVIMNGADPGVMRRVHDMTAALCRAAGIIPSQSTPGADRQVIRDTRTP